MREEESHLLTTTQDTWGGSLALALLAQLYEQDSQSDEILELKH